MIKIRSSTLARVMTCSGSIEFTEAQKDSDYAKEGTAFHEYVEKVYKGETVGDVASNGVPFDQDMKHFAVKVLEVLPKGAEVETEIVYNPTENVTITGHIDYTWEEGDTLVIADLKYGHRVVDVEENYQLISYALGQVFRKRDKYYPKLKLMIIQPRAPHLGEWIRETTITIEQLQEYYNKVVAVCSEIERGNKTLSTSDKCRYCPGILKCSAANKAFYNAVDVAVSFNQNDLSLEEMGHLLRTYERVKDIFKIRMESLQEEAKERLTKGENIPGYSLTKQYGHRKWRKDLDAETIKLLTGVDMNKTVLKSPAELEREKVDQTLIDSLSEKEFKGYLLSSVDAATIANKVFGGT